MSRDWTFYLEDILESGLKIQQFTRGLTLEQSWTMCINPRRPGLVARVVDWPYSTFHGYVDVGLRIGRVRFWIYRQVNPRRVKYSGGRRCAFPPYVLLV